MRGDRLVGIEPARVELGAKPRDLALGELPGREDRAFPERGGIRRALKMLPGLAVADGAERREVRSEIAAPAQRAYFVEEPRGEHRVETRGNALMQRSAIARHERELEDPPRRTLGRAATRTTSRVVSSTIRAIVARPPTTDHGVQVTCGPIGPGSGAGALPV